MKKLICALLTVILLCTVLAGCSSDKARIVGTWEGKMDATDMMNELWKYGFQQTDLIASFLPDGVPLPNDFDVFSEITIEYTYTFDREGEGEFSSHMSDKMVKQMGEDLALWLKDYITEAFTAYIEEELKKAGYDVDADTYLVRTEGYTLAKLVDQMMQEVDTDSLGENLAASCVEEGAFEYYIEDGLLYIQGEGGAEEKDLAYHFKSNDRLVLTMELAPKDAEMFNAGPIDITFRRVD